MALGHVLIIGNLKQQYIELLTRFIGCVLLRQLNNCYYLSVAFYLPLIQLVLKETQYLSIKYDMCLLDQLKAVQKK